jgi:hypothetical protein
MVLWFGLITTGIDMNVICLIVVISAVDCGKHRQSQYQHDTTVCTSAVVLSHVARVSFHMVWAMCGQPLRYPI